MPGSARSASGIPLLLSEQTNALDFIIDPNHARLLARTDMERSLNSRFLGQYGISFRLIGTFVGSLGEIELGILCGRVAETQRPELISGGDSRCQ